MSICSAIYIRMNDASICIYARTWIMYIYIYIYTYAQEFAWIFLLQAIYIYTYKCTHMCVYAIYLCINTHTCLHDVHIQREHFALEFAGAGDPNFPISSNHYKAVCVSPKNGKRKSARLDFHVHRRLKIVLNVWKQY